MPLSMILILYFGIVQTSKYFLFFISLSFLKIYRKFSYVNLREALYEKRSKPGYASITCSKLSNIPDNLIFTTKFNDSSILFTIISWDYLNSSLANEYVGDVTIPTQVIKYNQIFSPGGSANQIAIFTSN